MPDFWPKHSLHSSLKVHQQQKLWRNQGWSVPFEDFSQFLHGISLTKYTKAFSLLDVVVVRCMHTKTTGYSSHTFPFTWPSPCSPPTPPPLPAHSQWRSEHRAVMWAVSGDEARWCPSWYFFFFFPLNNNNNNKNYHFRCPCYHWHQAVSAAIVV